MKIYFFEFLAVIVFCSCIKDQPKEPSHSDVTISAGKSVLIINEGNYGWGNASVSLYDPTNDGVIADYYKEQNNGLILGDVCQSITKYNDKYYIVVNNSHKIEVVNASDFKKIASITGFNSPRYFLPITYNKAYVSDLYKNSIQIVDINTNAIIGSIPCMKGTEEMISIYSKAFVINPNSNYCYVLNTANDAITDSLFVGKESSGIVIDKNSKVWILTEGSSSNSQKAQLVRINPITLSIELSLTFGETDRPWRLRFNKTRDTLFYLNRGVYTFPIANSQLNMNPIISQGSKLYYGLNINTNNYTIYVSDAIDYVQKSKIEIYDGRGSFIKSFNAGIISNGFIFE